LQQRVQGDGFSFSHNYREEMYAFPQFQGKNVNFPLFICQADIYFLPSYKKGMQFSIITGKKGTCFCKILECNIHFPILTNNKCVFSPITRKKHALLKFLDRNADFSPNYRE